MPAISVDMSDRGDSKDAGQGSPAFTSGAGPHDARPSTVFGAPDQEEMVARLDAVADDDLHSDFFTAAVTDAQDAGARMFDVGIRTLMNELDGDGSGRMTGPSGSRVVGGGSAGAGGANADSPTSRVTAPVQGIVEVTVEIEDAGLIDLSDPDVQAAFVLGGPAAILRRG